MARPDLNSLLEVVLPFAQEMLAKHGEFYPFAATMTPQGQIGLTEGYTGEERPNSQELVDLLVGAFQAQAAKNELRATAICLDVRTIPPGETEKVDAICARLDHSDGESLQVFLPYSKDPSGEISYGKLFAVQGDQDIFG
jgi:hypothetical protein